MDWVSSQGVHMNSQGEHTKYHMEVEGKTNLPFQVSCRVCGTAHDAD